MDATEPITPDILLHHGAFVRRLARSLLGDEHLAEDLAQETWMRFLERPPAQAGSVRTWLQRVAHNLAVNTARSRRQRQKREVAAARPDAGSSPADEVAHASTLRSVVDAVEALAEPYRSTVLMRFFHGWDARRIAAHQGLPVATVRSRLQRALQSLRQRLDAEHDGDRRAWGVPLAGLAAAAPGRSGAVLALSAKAKVGAAVVVLAAAAASWSWLASPHPSPVRAPDVVAADLTEANVDRPNRSEDSLGARTPVAPPDSATRVVLAQAASLEVTVHDTSGRGVADAIVRVELDPSEQSELGRSNITPRDAKTNANGWAALPELWVGRKLQVQVRPRGALATSARRIHGSSLVLDGSDRGIPIILSAGESRSLAARVDDGLIIEGTVRHGDGSPAPQAHVAVIDEAGQATGEPGYLTTDRADETGRFRVVIRARSTDRQLRLISKEPATELAWKEHWKLGRMTPTERSVSVPTDGGAVALTLRPNEAEHGVIRRDLVLQPTLSITGLLLARDGTPAKNDRHQVHRLFAAPAGAKSHRAEGPLGRPRQTLEADGRFRIWGLAPGDYDLYVTHEARLAMLGVATFPIARHCFPAIPAGAQGIELRLPERAEVNVTVRTRGGEPDRMVVDLARLSPSATASMPGRPSPRDQLVNHLTGWPLGFNLAFQDLAPRGATGRYSCGGYTTKEVHEHALPPVEPGWYRFGVRAIRGSQSYFPVATELAYFAAGSYTVDFDLTPTTTAAGRIHGSGTGEAWAVSLVDDTGTALPLQVVPGSTLPLVRILETSATGRFVLREVPVGEFHLRVGTRQQLEHGAFRIELPVELIEGENAPLDVRF